MATPPDRGVVPRTVAASRKVTVPVGMSPAGVVTVARSRTDCPTRDGLGALVTTVVVRCLLTIWVTAADVLPVWLASPPYTASRLWTPGGSDDTVSEAVPDERGALPRNAPPPR